jgi:hypothetical protein
MQALDSLVPQAKQLGVMSLPLPLLQLLSESSSTSSQGHIPAYNSLRSRAGVASMESEVQDPTPDNMSSMSTSGGQMNPKKQQSNAGQADKALLDEYIQTPPNASPRKETSRLPSMNGDGTRKVSAPAVNSLSTPECQSLPQELLDFARNKDIDLWAGSTGEGSDPLPSVHLHNTLQEFVNHLPKELIQQSSTLGTLVTIDQDIENGTRKQLGVDVEWVLGVSRRVFEVWGELFG